MPKALILYITRKATPPSGHVHAEHSSMILEYHDLSHLDAYIYDLIEKTSNIDIESIRVVPDTQQFLPRGTLRKLPCPKCGSDTQWQFVVRGDMDVPGNYPVWECTECHDTLPKP